MKKWGVILVLLSFIFLAMGLLVFQGSKVSAQTAVGGTYVGVDKCKGCHAKEYKDFEARKFSKAWSVLQMRGKTKDPECLKCHATGFGQPGGFVSEEATPNLKYKQCEACHGAGSIHASNPADKAAHEQMKAYVRDHDVCIACHVCMKTHKEADF
jgi:NAD-dependent dihydropyrimidine dehydrogenase PreA subunit